MRRSNLAALPIIAGVLVLSGCVREYIVRYDNPAQGGARIFKLDRDVGGVSVAPSIKLGVVTPDDCAYGIYQIVVRVRAVRRKTSIQVQCATPPIEEDDRALGDET